MTTIRAHPPVETPAGLVVALPPCETCGNTGVVRGVLVADVIDKRPCPNCRPDVFALAVPCPKWDWLDGRRRNCRHCNGTGHRHHGDYRVLKVLPILHWSQNDEEAPPCISAGHRNTKVYLCVGRFGGTPIDLPGAVPGGAALIVERETLRHDNPEGG